MRTLRHDARYALRGMLRTPAFTAVILATLALGIGANVAIFSVVNGILLRPLPYRDPERIVALSHGDPYLSVSEPEFMDYQRDAHSLSRLAAFTESESNLTGGDEPERVGSSRVSQGFFAVFGVAPQLGRVFTPEEEAPGGNDLIVISDGLWRRHFGADPAIIGKTLLLNETPRTVVGVMPPRFDYPSPAIATWTPLRLNRDSLWTRNNHYLQIVGTLAPGVPLAQAKTELITLGQRFSRDFPDTYFPGKPLVPLVAPLRDRLLGSTRPYLLALVGAVGFVLLIACVNVANLLLARGETRRKELAIRTALGASAARLTRQLLTESALLAIAGGVLGLAVAWWGVRLLVALAPSSIPRLGDVRVDLPVLAFTLTISLLTGLLFGLAPALRAGRTDSASTLKEGGKTSTVGSGLRRARRALVVSEVALAVVTLAGAGLLVRSLWKLQAIDLGFDHTSILTMRLSLPSRSFDDARSVEFYRQLIARVEQVPGVRAVAATGSLPLASGDDGWSIFVDGQVVKTIAEAPVAKPHQVTPGYFALMKIPMVRGRAFTDADREDAPPVTVVDETMARQLWPGQDPIGHTLKMFNDKAPWVTVVGVARNVRSNGFLDQVPPTMYFPYAQAGRSAYYTPRSMTLLAKAAGDPLALTGTVRRIVREIGPAVPVSQTQTMEQAVGASIASRRFTTTMLGAFATLALVLAGIGIYGVIAYGVSQRTSEIGLRMALGAGRRSVLMLVLSEGLRMTLVGLALGIAGALAVARLLRSLLVGVTAVDLPTLTLVSLVLAGVAILACALPARRAMRVSPTEALKGGGNRRTCALPSEGYIRTSMPLSLSRRAFTGSIAALLSSLSIARRAIGAPHGASSPAAPPLDRAALLALGAAVLPAELGDTGLRRAVNDFERWLGAYSPRAEVLHGYGTATLEKLPPSPASRWAAQLRQLDGDARKRHGKPLTACAVGQRRALVHDRLRGEQLGAMPEPLQAGHIAIGLLAHFYGTPEAADLCYGAAIGKTTCRPLADQARKPAPVHPPA